MSEVKRKENTYAVAEFVFSNAETFKHILECIENLVEEVEMTIEYDGIKIRQMDPSRVAMIDYSIEKEAFDEWKVHTRGDACFNVSNALKQVPFKRVSKDTKVKVFIDGKDEKIVFTLIDSRTRERDLPLLEIMAEKLPVPKIVFKVQTKLVAKTLIDDLEDLKDKFEHATFVADTDQLMMKGASDIGPFRNRYRRGGDIILDHRVDEESNAMYSVSYLTGFALNRKVLMLCDVVTLSWAKDMPLKVELLSTISGTSFVHWLAPRIEVE